MTHGYPITPVPFDAVAVDGGFWAPRLETNRTATLPYCFRKCEETGRIDNFSKAAGQMEGPHEGLHFNDSDVFKVMEGAACALCLYPDPDLEAYLDGLIAKVAGAQEDDGYLYTIRTIDPDAVPPRVGKLRWSRLSVSHELYNVGHMYEAAVAHHRATGRRTFLEVALKNADLLVRTFGPAGIRDVPGHQEIEMGLAKLYRTTGERKYLDLAKFFLDERGRANGRELGEDAFYRQDHLPVTAQTEAVGHAVRAGYMYSGMADVAALAGDRSYSSSEKDSESTRDEPEDRRTGEPEHPPFRSSSDAAVALPASERLPEGLYIAATDRLWDDVVSKKLYLTGGIGARHEGEAFGKAYELPNETAYCETCAAIANAMWNHRMFLLHGEAKYLDVLERVLYNGFLSGVSFAGTEFFYPNPLASDGQWAFNKGANVRQPWFGCSCCPTNVVRFIPSLPGYIYATDGDRLFVNLFVGSRASVEINGRQVGIAQTTRYPWDGRVRIDVTPERQDAWTLWVRIPGWAQDRPAPGDLYRYLRPGGAAAEIRVNGAPVPLEMRDGFACIQRVWTAGDMVEITLPMGVRRVLSHGRVTADRGRVALERGPVVYCAEGVDNRGAVRDLALPDNAPIEAAYRDDLLNGVVALRGTALKGGQEHPFTAIPYYAWCHRGAGEMAVWLKRNGERVSENDSENE